ncbi:MAG: MarR family winged helix-turn-helix transcriptional regulator [Ruminococcus sp.]|jgi:DNA-binding MarR family transcriptional regulator|uniref:MarR family winged helix-turn-helix transcriptional regulator n=1 Tax=uncultured Ruminococcus sp. TaxID=165186 RepID=UPI0026301D58|nr:MarR family transcriptional regulator [uncultured Ruminococcus sp.]
MTVSELQLQFIRLYKEMNATYYQLAAAQELSPSEMDIYYTLCVLGDGCLQRDICNLALTSKQTINSALKKMEKQGFLWLEAGKGREKHIHLTPAGKKIQEHRVRPIYLAEQAVLAEMGDPEQTQLIALLEKYIRLLQQRTANLQKEELQ